MSRARNFANYPYWRLHLDAVVDEDPCPLGAPEADLVRWRDRVRVRLRSMLGSEPVRVPPDVEALGDVDLDCGAYTRTRLVFDTEALMSVPAYLLVPKTRTRPGPAVLAVHGHGPGKSLVCGTEPGGPGDDYAHALAEAGFVVLAPDLRGFGERSEWTPPDKYHCDWDLVCATMAGVTPLGRNLWDLARALDVLGQHPLVDDSRLAVAGFSYGATCALFLAAIDERVRASVVSGYLSSWRAAHTVPWNMCGSQVLPAQLGRIEHLDVASLVTPRPMLVESGRDDVLFPVDAAVATVTALQQVAAALGAPDGAVVHDVFDGEHRFHGALVTDFLRRWL